MAGAYEGTLLASGDLMTLDNQGNQSLSRVEIFDPASHAVRWSHDGTPENGFYTEICGATQLRQRQPADHRVPDGRAFELTSEQDIVWDYRWEERSADEPGLVAMLFDMQRIAEDDPHLAWLAEQ